jgi:adenosylhomocysteinase
VTVVDVDPVTRLRAHLDGFSTPPREQASADADLIITVTGSRHRGLSRCRRLARVRR